jgi:hypothetical protein
LKKSRRTGELNDEAAEQSVMGRMDIRQFARDCRFLRLKFGCSRVARLVDTTQRRLEGLYGLKLLRRLSFEPVAGRVCRHWIARGLGAQTEALSVQRVHLQNEDSVGASEMALSDILALRRPTFSSTSTVVLEVCLQIIECEVSLRCCDSGIVSGDRLVAQSNACEANSQI